jgi:hypothetical protein
VSKKFLTMIAMFMIVAGSAFSAEETDSRVPALEAFHEIIYPIWHTAYPEKDIAALKGYVPEIHKLAGKVFEAELPGILRDKDARWKAGLAELKNAVDTYTAAAQGQDDQALLDAAETLHAKYEKLVRTIRPVLKEMDEFHKVLYVVFHRYLPDGKYADIKAVSGDLRDKAEAVTKAVLSPRIEARTATFQTAAAEMLAASGALVAACRQGVDSAVKEAVLILHVKYQALEKVFD